ncbi:MAG: hypothetical protein Q8L04_00170 [Ignavibacteria bacterium]|nr:hypothetical protein [Ignavibacteria bacterium]
MRKLMLAVVVLASNLTFGQFINSVQVNGGLIFPSNSQNGPLAAIQLTHNIDNNWSLYVSVGFSRFDKNRVFTFRYLIDPLSYSEDSHELYNLSIGGRLILNTIKTFKIFADFEISYNHLKYNEYEMFLIYDEITYAVTGFYPKINSKKQTSEGLYGFGAGLGFLQQLSSNYAFTLEYKKVIQTKNMDYFRHYYALSFGLMYNL